MKTALVGYSGFVGTNLAKNMEFTNLYNSKNIEDAFNTKPDLLVYSGVPATMFIANANPQKDFEIILEAIENIKKIDAKRVVLISTVAVYDTTIKVDEKHSINEKDILPYGKNRLYLEKWVLKNCDNSLVVRLPAIYGDNLKKNFIYDYINIIPKMLNQNKYDELSRLDAIIENSYELQVDNFYHCKDANNMRLYNFFLGNSFNATHFTDSRSNYQFYNLNNLCKDVNTALKENIRLLNITTEPVSVAEVYKYLCGKEFTNYLSKDPFDYNVKSIYAELFGGNDGYMLGKEQVLNDIKEFVEREIKIKWA